MKNKFINILFLLLFITFIGNGIYLQSKEIKGIELIEKNIYVEKNFTELIINDNNGTIQLKNDYFIINSFYTSYSLAKSAISENLLLLQCENQIVKYMCLDFEKETLNYIIQTDGIKYYSSIDFNNIICSVDLNDNTNISKVKQSSKITYECDLNKYRYLEDLAYDAYILFEIPQYSAVNVENSSQFNAYTFTGDSSDDINNGYKMINEIFDFSLLSSVGLHYGETYNDNDMLKYIYVIDTELYSEDQYIAKVKTWEITYDSTSNIYPSMEKNIDLYIVKGFDAFIIGTSTSGDISLANKGYTYVPIKSISSNIFTSNYTYISKYKIGCTSEEVSSPAYISTLDNLLGYFVPYYETISAFINGVNNLSDSIQQISFNNSISEFNFTNEDKNLKQIGFKLSNTDVGTGIFNDEYLHNYSFYQDITISGVPNYYIDVNMQIQIVPLYYQDTTFLFSSELQTKNNYNCTHIINNENQDENIHIASCDYCGYNYYEGHILIFENQGASGHLSQCDSCDYSFIEEHSFDPAATSKLCEKCDYFELINVRYISNNDGLTHTIRGSSGIAIENCFGVAGDPSGNVYCSKCGQLISTGLVSLESELLVNNYLLSCANYLDSNYVFRKKEILY